MPEVYTNKMVQTRSGEMIGRICTVWERGAYVGSYFEQIVQVHDPGICRNLGINHGYLREREAREGGPPQNLISWIDRL